MDSRDKIAFVPSTGPSSDRTDIHTSVRQMPLDAARGIAVLGMIYLHLVPTEGAKSASDAFWTHLAQLLDGKSAALFCILAGMSWSLQAQRAYDSPRFPIYVLRRTLSLGLAGLLLHLTLWPTEILIPLALMMPLSRAMRPCGTKALALAILLLVLAIPIFHDPFQHYASLDWNEDGGHLADRRLGWVSLRYLLFDGNYPLIPWLSFPLVGTLLLAQDWKNRFHAKIVPLTAIAAMVGGHAVDRCAATDTNGTGRFAAYLTATWVPTSIPFLLITGGYAVAVVSCLLLWNAYHPLPVPFQSLAALGRASLTHYVLHILTIIVPLRLAFPGEEWPVRTGLFAFALYVLLAIPLSVLWFRRFPRGPFESLWANVSGPTRL